MNQNPSKEVVAATAHAAPNSAKVKKVARVAGAAVFTFAMFGTLALPAYAFDNSEAPVAQAAAAQSIKVTAGYDVATIADIPLEVDSSVAEQERRDKEIKEAKEKQAERKKSAATSGASGAAESASSATDVPAGVGAGGIASAALAQLGQNQDCTALVERALRAVGYSVGDLGPAQFAQFGPTVGYVHGQTALAPGDILIWGNAHVAIYVGNGAVVHGGWSGGTTVLAGLTRYGNDYPNLVVRMS